MPESLSPSGEAAGRAIDEETPFLPGPGRDASAQNGGSYGAGDASEEDALHDQQNWNQPKINIARFASANFTFLIMGMNDACLGALIPFIEKYYDISHARVSTLFVVPFFGYLVAALSNSWIHYTIGQRGIAFLGALCRMIGYIPMALHPPFSVLPAFFLFTGFGNGINDSAWNAWVGNLRKPNELLGILHGVYGVGGTLAPIVGSVMVARWGLNWYTFFYVMIGLSVLEFVVCGSAFWGATAADYREKLRLSSGGDGEERKPMGTNELLRSGIAWVAASFIFCYVGVEVCLGGWIPTFMLEERGTDGFTAGLTATLFWLSLTLGRFILGFVTGRVGEKMAVATYLGLCVALELVYWLIPAFAVSMVAVALLGFFLGPLFPAIIAALTKLLPPEQHVATIGFSSAVGGGGAALFPFMVGAIAEKSGVGVLQPFVLVLLVIVALLWLLLPGGLKQGGLERARKEKASVGDGFRQALRWIRGSRS